MHSDQFTLDAGALGQRIAALRRDSGWSQRRLAAAAGVSHGYIALLELGRLPSPGKFRLDAVARALGLRTSDALTVPLLPSAQASPPAPAVERSLPPSMPRSLRTPPPGATLREATQSNVVGGLEQLRASSGARPL